jgi:hypothetical protein
MSAGGNDEISIDRSGNPGAAKLLITTGNAGALKLRYLRAFANAACSVP